MRALLFSALAWLWVAGSVAGQSPLVRTEDYKYPKTAPVLSVALPSGWTVNEQDGPAQLLLCSPPGDSSYFISIMTLPTVGSKAGLADILTKITRAGAVGSGLNDIKVSEAAEVTIGGAPRVFTRVTASGSHDGEAGAFGYHAFSLPGTGKTYAVGAAGLQVLIEAHRAEFEAVARSIAPVN